MNVNRIAEQETPPFPPSGSTLLPPVLKAKGPEEFCGLLVRVDDERRQKELYERLRAEGVSCRLVNW